MAWIKRFFYISIYINLLIALAAVAQAALTYLHFSEHINPYILCIEGCATMLLYNFAFILAKPKDPQSSPYARSRWVFRHEGLIWSSMLLCVGLLGFVLFKVHVATVIYLGFVGLVSISYSLPILNYQGKRGGLRLLPGVKIFHIALVWTLSTAGLPLVEMMASGKVMDWYLAGYHFGLRFLFLLICTLPFDIRDIRQDAYYHLKTLATLLGKERASSLCYLIVLLHTILLLGAPYAPYLKTGLIVSNLLVLLVLRLLVFRRKDHYHYVYLLDYALIVQLLVVLLFRYFMNNANG